MPSTTWASVQLLTGDYPAAAASMTEALGMFRDIGDRQSQASTLTNLGEVLARSGDSHQARDHYARALAIARDISAPVEEARALEGLGRCLLRDGDPGGAAANWQQALDDLPAHRRPGRRADPGHPAPARYHHSPAASQRPKTSARRTHRTVSHPPVQALSHLPVTG